MNTFLERRESVMIVAGFKSNNRAVQFISVISKFGVHGELVNMPAIRGGKGCAYGVRFNKTHLSAVRQAAGKAGVRPDSFYRYENGEYSRLGDL